MMGKRLRLTQHFIAGDGDRCPVTLFGDTIAEMSNWDCFKPKARRSDKSEWGSLTSLGIPHREPLRKIGRNDPCPCGSGKKFKKCCLTSAFDSLSLGEPSW
jgi:hypothetical protein